MVPLTVMGVFFLRRTLLEDRMLIAELPGYAEYASRVRYRLVVGVI
jgi:protein-S-isoprenylcysteine O-methyltransferase Ste14